MIHAKTHINGYVVTTVTEGVTFRIEICRNDDTRILFLKTFILGDNINVHHEGIVMLVSIGKLPIIGESP